MIVVKIRKFPKQGEGDNRRLTDIKKMPINRRFYVKNTNKIAYWKNLAELNHYFMYDQIDIEER